LSGRGWDTDDSVSRSVSFFAETLPVSGATVSGLYKIGYIDPVTSALTYPMTLTSAGVPTFLSPVPLASGGSNAALVASHGAIVYSTAAALAFSGVGNSGQLLRSAGAASPTWTTSTFPSASPGAGTYLRGDGTNWITSTLTLPNAANAGDILVASGANAYASQAPAALTRTNDTNVTLTLGGSPTTALIAATSLTMGWSGTLAGSRGGTGYASLKLAGIAYGISTSYIDGTGTAGVDNTAQTVKTIQIPAGTLTQLGDRIHIRVVYRPDTGTAVTATATVNGVTVLSLPGGTAALMLVMDLWLSYIDSTHANISSVGATGNVSLLAADGVGNNNVAGFDWTVAQDVDIDQNAVLSNHITVYEIVGTVYPKGVVLA
jgi:hypothetical protein